MRGSAWTKEQDYAVAFGTGLGMSARQIAASLGVTRNMVLGRIFRLRKKDGEVTGTMPNNYRRAVPRIRRGAQYWTDEEIEILRSNPTKTSAELQALLPKRTVGAIESQRYIRQMPRPPRADNPYYYTEQDEETIRQDWLNNVPIEEIAAKLGRTVGSIRQKVFAAKLRRDSRMVKLVKRFGADVTKISDDPNEIRRLLYERDQAQKAAASAKTKEQIKDALDRMEADIANGVERQSAFRAALALGATLQAIGDRVNLTRERVRQIIYSVRSIYIERPPAELTCARCKGKFFAQGNRRYCDPCRPYAYSEKVKARMDRYRQFMKEEGKKEEAKRGCKSCGASIADRAKNAKYCIPCSFKQHAVANREHMRRIRLTPRDPDYSYDRKPTK